jgi:acetyl esterase/lipase
MPLTTYSCRFYYTPVGGPETYLPTAFPHLISFKQGGLNGTDRFSLMLSDAPAFTSFQGQRPIVKGETNAIDLITASGGQLTNSTTWRIEIQVMAVPISPVTHKLTIKIYQWDSTTPWRTINCNPASVAADSFMLGRHPLKSGGNWIGQNWIGDVEVFDTYDLDGTVGQHYQTPSNKWYEIIDGVEEEVIEEGIVTSGTVNTTDKNNWYDFREFVYDESNYTEESYYYDYPDRLVRAGAIYYRNDTPPPGGWPLISFWHGGFFSGGSLYDVPIKWVKRLLYEGFAVTTGEYIRARSLLGLTTWPAQQSGRYPSFFIDPKIHQLTMIARGANGTGQYPINTDKTCIVGHSAGGCIALGAAVSRDLILGAYNLTVNHPIYGNSTSTPDPEFKCCYVYSPPTDMKWAYDNDPTFSINGVGLLRVTAAAYMGYEPGTTLTAPMMVNTRITDMIAAQTPSKIPPIGMVTGLGDGTVPLQHSQFAETALAAKGISLDHIYTNKDHDNSCILYPEEHLLNFLGNNGMI